MDKVSSRKGVNKAILQMVVSAMMLALALLLDFVCGHIPGLRWPNGGTIAPTMLPLFLAGLICGPVWGFGVSFIFGVLNFLIDGWGYNWVSVLLDYIFGFGLCGVCSFFSPFFYKKQVGLPVVGMILGGLLRFTCSFFSGCLVMWDANGSSYLDPTFTPGTVAYSAVYNLGYIIPSVIVCIIIFLLIAKSLFIIVDDYRFKNLRPSYIVKGNKKNSVASALLDDLGQDDIVIENNEKEENKGLFGRFSLESLAPFLTFAILVLTCLSLIPTIHYQAVDTEFVVDFLALAYIGIIFSVIIMVISAIRFVKLIAKKDESLEITGLSLKIFKEEKNLLIFLLVISIITIVLSSVSLYLHYAVYLPLE